MNPASSRVRLSIQVTPNARRSEVGGIAEGVLRIRLQAPPVDGKANEALVRFLADALGLPKNAVAVVAGHASRRKIVEINGSGMTGPQLVAALSAGNPSGA